MGSYSIPKMFTLYLLVHSRSGTFTVGGPGLPKANSHHIN